MSKFEIGQRVKHENYGEGKVIQITPIHCCVEFDKENSNFHDNGGDGKKLHCYWVDNDTISLIEPNNKIAEIGDYIHILWGKHAGESLRVTDKCFCGCVKVDGDHVSMREYEIVKKKAPKQAKTVEKFEEGKSYIFDRKTYLANGGCCTANVGWPVTIDGMEVIVESSKHAHICYKSGDEYGIQPHWCIEKPTAKPEVNHQFEVGDMVKIKATGEICKVIALNKIGISILYVRTKERSHFVGDASDRPIVQPFTYVDYSEIEHYIPTKRIYTAAQIAEAKQYVMEKMYGLTKEGKFIVFTKLVLSNKLYAQIFITYPFNVNEFDKKGFTISSKSIKLAYATCSDNDTFTLEIGKMVATAKLFGDKLPSWVTGE